MGSTPNFGDAFLQSYMAANAQQAEQRRQAQQFQFQNFWNNAKQQQDQQQEAARLAQQQQYQSALIKDTQDRASMDAGKAQLEAQRNGAVPAQPMQATPLQGLPQQQPADANSLPASQSSVNSVQRGGVVVPPEGAVNLGGMLLRQQTPQELAQQQQQIADQQVAASQQRLDKMLAAGLLTPQAHHQLSALNTIHSIMGNADPTTVQNIIAPKPPDVKAGDEPLTPDQIAQHNALAKQLGTVNGVDTSNAMLKPGATRNDLKTSTDSLNAISTAVGAKAQRDQTNAARQGELQRQLSMDDARRSDLSYRSSTAEVDKIAKPITDLAPRIARLEDTLSQKNLQADALVAPELLTIVAGGAGSGIRVNEAEITRVLGGRVAAESFKAFVQKVAGDPSTARSITPVQDQQIHKLLDTVKKTYAPVQQAVDDAHETLANSTDPAVHKQAVLKVHQAISSLSKGSTTYANTATGPDGHKIGTNDGGKTWFDVQTGQALK